MKKSILLIVFAIMMIHKGFAQESLVSNLSDSYLDRLIDIAKASHPHLKGEQEKINEAKDNVSKANIAYLDIFNVSYIYQPQTFNTFAGSNTAGSNSNQNYNFNGIQAGVNFNLGNFFSKPYAVKQAKHELAIANEEKNEYILTLTNEVKKRYYTYILNVENLKLLTQTALDAQNVTNNIKRKFESGEDTFDNYSKSQVSLRATYQAKIQAEAALLIAKADLEALLGEKLEDIK